LYLVLPPTSKNIPFAPIIAVRLAKLTTLVINLAALIIAVSSALELNKNCSEAPLAPPKGIER